MKIINNAFLILICLILTNCNLTEKKVKSFTLQGKISGQDTGNIILSYGFGTGYHKATSKIKDGKFSFSGIIDEPTRGIISGKDILDRTDIYLEPGVMSITLSIVKPSYIKIEGSKSQDELINLNKALISTNNHDSVLLSFVSRNPKSYLTPYYLQLLYPQSISLDSLKTIFYRLDLNIQKSRFGRYIKGIITQNENTRLGAEASEFRAIDVNNKIITLSQFKKKSVVMLEFWNSMCTPCRKSFPHLKSLYNKYHYKGLEIIAITWMDKNKESWVSAINQDSTNMWYHVATAFINGETINEELAFDYPTHPVPQTILIDKNGIIIGYWEGYTKENEDSLDQKLAEIFN